MTHSLGSTALKEGCVCNARTLHTHTWCGNGFPWTELGFYFITSFCLEAVPVMASPPNPILPRISWEESTSWVPWVAKFEGLKGKQGEGWQAGDFSRCLCLIVCMLRTPVELQWADGTCFTSSPETAIFSLCPQYVQTLSQIYDISQPMCIPSPQSIILWFEVDFSTGLFNLISSGIKFS